MCVSDDAADFSDSNSYDFNVRTNPNKDDAFVGLLDVFKGRYVEIISMSYLRVVVGLCLMGFLLLRNCWC